MPDLEHYEGREQGFVKHTLIEKYLERFAIIISKNWDEIAYIDAFAGPWGAKSDDLSDTSFCIALKCLKTGVEVAREKFHRKIGIRAFLIEQDRNALKKLREFGKKQNRPGFQVSCFHGAFEEKVGAVRSSLEGRGAHKTFVFALIDPKGWSGLSIEVIAPLVQKRSSEILVNVMTSFVHRFVDVENCKDSYQRFFGRTGVRAIISNTPQEDRQDAVVREYCRSLRQFCGFKHVSSCVILEPDKEGIKYFMVYATNDPTGIKVFKEAEAHAAFVQDELKDQKSGEGTMLLPLGSAAQVSEKLRARYRKIAFRRVVDCFVAESNVPYTEVFCKAMAMPLVTEIELIEFLNSHSTLRLELEGKLRKRPDIRNENDRVKLRSPLPQDDKG